MLKIFNICAMFFIVIGALCWGIWGFFTVQILDVFFGHSIARILYCVVGIFGLYGCHLFMDYSKRIWRS